jgi:peptide/nickel transport system substrate-binding protein
VGPTLPRVVALLSVALLSGACSGVPAVPGFSRGPVQGGQVVEAIAGTAGPLNPLFEQEDNEKDIDSVVYQGLTTVDANEQVVGLLAKDWKVSQDGLTYTFNLRPGIRWADGKPFSADDVVFTFGVLQSPDYQQPTDQDWKAIQVQKTGALQVQFDLKAPSASFPLALRQGMIARHLFGGVSVATMAASSRSGARAVGTGPFMVGWISPDRHEVRLDRNPYASPAPNLDHLVFRTYPSLADAVDAVSRGEADSAGELALPNISTLIRRQDLALMQLRTFNFAGVLFNLTPDQAVYFSPPSVRQALTQAVDRQRIVREVLEGRADAAPGPIPPSDWAFSRQAGTKLPFNRAQAQQMLAAAGWVMNMQTGVLGRAGRDFSISLVTADAYPYRQVAEAVSAQLRLVGVQVAVVPVPASVLVSKYLIGKQYQMALAAFDNGPDPDQYSFWHSGATPDTLNFTSQDRLPKQALIDKDLEDGRASTDLAARKAAYSDFQDLMADAAPAIFVFEPHYTYVVSRRVRGLHTNPVIEPVDRFEYVTDWYVTTQGG